jgi:hypothetical protein
MKQTKEGPKNQEGKPEWAVLPWEALEHVVRVFEYGASPEKYKNPYTYRPGITFSKLFSASIRHLIAWWKGEDYAPDSGCHHLAHVCANCLMLLAMTDKKQFDNRDKEKKDGSQKP